MKKTRRLLALFLALVLCLSGTASAFAQGAQDDPASGNNDGVTVKAIDPSTLKVKKLAEKLDMSNIAKPSEQTAKYAPEDVVRVSIVLSDPSTMDAGYSVKRISEDRDAKAYRESLKTQQAAVAAETVGRRSVRVARRRTAPFGREGVVAVVVEVVAYRE